MLQNHDLHRLAGIDASPHQTVSLYLGLDKSRDLRVLELGRLMDLKRQQIDADNGQRNRWQDMEDDFKRVIRYVEEMPLSSGRGLALFACGAKDLFEAHALSTRVPDRLEVSPVPYLGPLALIARDQDQTVTVLLDKKKARFFVELMGNLSEVDDLVNQPSPGYEPGGDQGRTGDNQVSRWEEQEERRFWKQVATRLKTHCEKNRCGRLLVGGARQAMQGLMDELPPSLAPLVAGTFALDTGASLAQVGEAARPVLAQDRARRQAELLDQVQESLGPAGKAVTGLNPVLAALYEGKVHTLVVGQGFMASGGHCPECGRLRHVAERCPICQREMTPVNDVVDLALAQALRVGARVEQVDGDPRLDHWGQVAALLRYA